MTLSNVDGASLDTDSTATRDIADNEPATGSGAFEQSACTVTAAAGSMTVRSTARPGPLYLSLTRCA